MFFQSALPGLYQQMFELELRKISSLSFIVVIFHSILLACADIKRTEDGFSAAFTEIREGRLVGGILDELENTEIDYCMYRCAIHRKCKTINYDHDSATCQILRNEYGEAFLENTKSKWYNYGTQSTAEEPIRSTVSPKTFSNTIATARKKSSDREPVRRTASPKTFSKSIMTAMKKSSDRENVRSTSSTNTYPSAIMTTGKRSRRRSVCPETHPYAYADGNRCCKYKKERKNPSDLSPERCDGSELSLSSSCCYDRKSIKCPQIPCRSNKGGISI